MARLNYEDIDTAKFEVLREIGNIGGGNATTALSQIINSKIDMKIPKVELLEFKELAEVVGGAECLVVGILLTVHGDINGMMMFMLEKESAHHLLKLLFQRGDNAPDEFSEMDLSALKEVGNIIAGAYLSSLSLLTNLVITASVPYMSVDMAGAILSVPAIEFGKIGDKALLIDSRFSQNDKEISGYFILIPTLESYNSIMSSFGL